MSRLECLGNSSFSSQKQLAEEVTSVDTETNKPNGTAAKKRVTDKPRRSLSAHALLCPVQVSRQESQRSGSVSGEALKTEGCSPKESINTTPRVEEQAQSTAVPDEELKMKCLSKAHSLDSAVTGEMMHAPPPIEDDGDSEDPRAPLELIIMLFGAVIDHDFRLARLLCDMILIYEPENPEISEFLPLIEKKLLKEQELDSEDEDKDEDEDEDEDDYDDDDDDDDDDFEGDEELSARLSSSSSAPNDDEDGDDEEEEKHVNGHKPCPSSPISA